MPTPYTAEQTEPSFLPFSPIHCRSFHVNRTLLTSVLLFERKKRKENRKRSEERKKECFCIATSNMGIATNKLLFLLRNKKLEGWRPWLLGWRPLLLVTRTLLVADGITTYNKYLVAGVRRSRSWAPKLFSSSGSKPWPWKQRRRPLQSL